MKVEYYIDSYRRGVYTGKELVLKVALLITRENLETVMKSIPEECLHEFRTMAFTDSDETTFLFNFHGTPLQEREILDQLEAVRPFLEDWFSRR